MVYQWKSGARINADANKAGEMCAQLEAKGNLSAKSLLDANRPADAPLHDAFEWDDSIAAEAYREDQARYIIRSLVVVKEQAEPVRSFFNIVQAENRYQSIETILSDKDSTALLLEKAMRELEAFKRKYQSLEQLRDVFAAIDDASEQLKIAV